jgi:hypothetical protein
MWPFKRRSWVPVKSWASYDCEWRTVEIYPLANKAKQSLMREMIDLYSGDRKWEEEMEMGKGRLYNPTRYVPLKEPADVE